jgi:hypothetical protein
MADYSIKVAVDINDAASIALSNLSKQASSTDKALKSMGQTGSSSLDKITSSINNSLSSFDIFKGNVASNVLGRAFDIIASSAKGLFDAAINGAAESEQAIKNMNVALIASGIYTERTSKSFEVFAAELQKTTIYSDEMVLSSVQLLSSLTDLDENGIKAASTAAADLASTLNISLAEASEMIAKAINGNVTAFKRKGIEIKNADTSSQRLSNTLQALSKFTGFAEQSTNTYAGATKVLANQQGELFESLGKIITQNPAFVDSIKSKSKLLEELAGWVNKNTKFINDLFLSIGITTGIIAGGAIAILAAKTAFISLSVALATGTTVFELLGFAAASAWAAITAPISLIVIGLGTLGVAIYGLVKNWDFVRASAKQAGAAVFEFLAKGIDLIGGNSKELRTQAKEWREQAKSIEQATAAQKDNLDSWATLANERAKFFEDRKKEKEFQDFETQQRQRTKTELELIEKEHNINMSTIRGENGATEIQQRHDLEMAKLQLAYDRDKAEIQLEQDAFKRRKKLLDLDLKLSVDKAKQEAKTQEQKSKQEIQNREDTYKTIATLATSSNKTLATIGKAFAIRQALIDGYAAVQKALASAPPPFNFALAALVGAATAQNVANIAGVKFASGGIVQGTSYTGDNVQARLNSGEMVLNRSQQSRLFEFANGRGIQSSGLTREEVAIMISEASNRPIVVQMNGREIVNVVREELRSGRNFN